MGDAEAPGPALEDQPQLVPQLQPTVEDRVAALREEHAKRLALLEAEIREQRLRAELLDRAVGVPPPGASECDKLKLAVTGQVNSKLARFGLERGCAIAVLVLLCNVGFISVFVSNGSSKCEQRTALMDPNSPAPDAFTRMFKGTSTGGTLICSSTVNAVTSYSAGDTCTIAADTGRTWMGKNGECNVDTGLCAPGTDCTDCPDDTACEAAFAEDVDERIRAYMAIVGYLDLDQMLQQANRYPGCGTEPGRDACGFWQTGTDGVGECNEDLHEPVPQEPFSICTTVHFNPGAGCGGRRLQAGQPCGNLLEYAECVGQECEWAAMSCYDAGTAPPITCMEMEQAQCLDEGPQCEWQPDAHQCSDAGDAPPQPCGNLLEYAECVGQAEPQCEWAAMSCYDAGTAPPITCMEMEQAQCLDEGPQCEWQPDAHQCADAGDAPPQPCGNLLEYAECVGQAEPQCEWAAMSCYDAGTAPPMPCMEMEQAQCLDEGPQCEWLPGYGCESPPPASPPGVSSSCEAGSFCRLYEGLVNDILHDPVQIEAVCLPGSCPPGYDCNDCGDASATCRMRTASIPLHHLAYPWSSIDRSSGDVTVYSTNDWDEWTNQPMSGPDFEKARFGFRANSYGWCEGDGTAPGGFEERMSFVQDTLLDGSDGLFGCEYADDGDCDEGAGCRPGTDSEDCGGIPLRARYANFDERVECANHLRLRYDSCTTGPNIGARDEQQDPRQFSAWSFKRSRFTPLFKNGQCNVDTGDCLAGTDCTDCPNDSACPGVAEKRLVACHVQGLACAQYVREAHGTDHPFTKQCGIPEAEEVCAASNCMDVSEDEGAVASVVYISCPQVTTVLGAAMGYVFAIEILATVTIVPLFVLATGGSCRSAWDHTRTVLRAQAATETQETTLLLEESQMQHPPKTATRAWLAKP